MNRPRAVLPSSTIGSVNTFFGDTTLRKLSTWHKNQPTSRLEYSVNFANRRWINDKFGGEGRDDSGKSAISKRQCLSMSTNQSRRDLMLQQFSSCDFAHKRAEIVAYRVESG